jgi:hypothetical protein
MAGKFTASPSDWQKELMKGCKRLEWICQGNERFGGRARASGAGARIRKAGLLASKAIAMLARSLGCDDWMEGLAER